MAARKPRRGGPRFGKLRPFNKKQIGQLPDDQPVVYEGLTSAGTNLYTGSAKRGRVQERLLEHKEQGDLPGVTQFRIKKMLSVGEARAEEKRIIKQEQPKINEQGK